MRAIIQRLYPVRPTGINSVFCPRSAAAAPAKPASFSERWQSNFTRHLRAWFFIDEQAVGILPS